MRTLLPPITLTDLACLRYEDLQPHMIEQRWRTPRNFIQRRITPRLDKAGEVVKGWRVSHEKQVGGQRERIQQSFYFGSKGGFEKATDEAHAFRDRLELEHGLVSWRLKPVGHLENAFCPSSITLQFDKGRSPYWLYRGESARVSSSVAAHGVRGGYLDLVARVYGLDAESPCPILGITERAKLISANLVSHAELEELDLHTYQWVRNYLISQRKKALKAA